MTVAVGTRWIHEMMPELTALHPGPDRTTRRELRGRLASVLYRRWHCGAGDETSPDLPGKDDRPDPTVEAALTAAVPHPFCEQGGIFLGPSLLDPAQVRVALPEAVVTLPADRVVQPDPTPGAAVQLRLPPVRPRISPGYLYLHGSRRWADGPVRRIFVHLTDPVPAADRWADVLGLLEDSEIPYHSKICSSATGFPRQDAWVTYLSARRAELADRVADRVAALVTGRPGVGERTSWFADRLAPGVAVADDPIDPRPGYAGMSFGQHRAFLVASALVSTADPADLPHALETEFTRALVDPDRPGRNLPTDQHLSADDDGGPR